MDDLRFMELLNKKLANELTFVEDIELSHCIETNSYYKTISQSLDILSDDNIKFQEGDLDVRKNWLELKKKIQERKLENSSSKAKRILFKRLAIAASFLIVLAGAFYFRGNNGDSNTTPNKIITHSVSNSPVNLPDGSVVVLSADSRLSYDEKFSAVNRVVNFEGEGFFNIKHDADHPFIVRTKDADVHVTGTVFRLTTSGIKNKFEAILIKGRIEVSLKDKSEQKIELKPSQKITILSQASSGDIKKTNQDSIQIQNIAITDSMLASFESLNQYLDFRNNTLEEIAVSLERQYHIKVIITGNVKRKKYTGAFKNKDLKYVLEILKLSNNFNYNIKNDTLIIN